jgi:hypothetical protein
MYQRDARIALHRAPDDHSAKRLGADVEHWTATQSGHLTEVRLVELADGTADGNVCAWWRVVLKLKPAISRNDGCLVDIGLCLERAGDMKGISEARGANGFIVQHVSSILEKRGVDIVAELNDRYVEQLSIDGGFAGLAGISDRLQLGDLSAVALIRHD